MKIKLVILLCMLILCQGCSDDSLQYVEEVYPAEKDAGQERTFETDIYDNIIFKAIKNHNKYEIEKDLNEREELFCKIIKN